MVSPKNRFRKSTTASGSDASANVVNPRTSRNMTQTGDPADGRVGLVPEQLVDDGRGGVAPEQVEDPRPLGLALGRVERLGRLHGQDRQEPGVGLREGAVAPLVVERQDAQEAGVGDQRRAQHRPHRVVPVERRERLLGARSVEPERPAVRPHPAQERLVGPVRRARAERGPHERGAGRARVAVDERDHALLGADGLERAADERVDGRVEVAGAPDGDGHLVEQRQLVDGASEPVDLRDGGRAWGHGGRREAKADTGRARAGPRPPRSWDHRITGS